MSRIIKLIISICFLAFLLNCSKAVTKTETGASAPDSAPAVKEETSLSIDKSTEKTPAPPVKEPSASLDSSEKAKAIPEAEMAKDYDFGGKAAATGRKKAKKMGKAAGSMSPAAAPAAPKATAVSGLKAGYADDNKQFNYFLSFLKNNESKVSQYPIRIEERIILRVRDKTDRPIANAQVKIISGQEILCAGKTYADGTFLFFPGEHKDKLNRYRAVVEAGQEKKEVALDRQGMREVVIKMNGSRIVPQNIPIDMLFVLDTTGSMGEEINRLKNTIEIINLNLASLSTKPDIRFGMVLYRDRGDDYVTKVVPLTRDLDQFRAELNEVSAGGGGDYPEDLQSALADTIKKIDWNQNGVRLAYIITDASPHLDYGQTYTYVDAVHDARKMGIKMFGVGTGGLDLTGEYVLRQIAQYTYAKYIFLTYGEKGESEGGKEGSVSHHTGANFQTDKLESIVIRFAKEELSFQSNQPLAEGEAYFQATPLADEGREDTLHKLFEMSIAQLIDYSSINITKGTTASVIPFVVEKKAAKANAEYFTEQMAFSLARNKTFRMVERKDMQKILEELKLQKTGIVDDEKAAKAGKLMGASIIITGRLYPMKENYEIFMKMLRVETGEVLSVNKLKIDGKLGVAN